MAKIVVHKCKNYASVTASNTAHSIYKAQRYKHMLVAIATCGIDFNP